MSAERPDRAVPRWVRYGGLAAVLASVLEFGTSTLVGVVFPEAFEPGTRDALLVGDVVVTYLVLGLVGIAALYGRYGRALGRVGLVGLLSIAVGAVVGIVATLVTGVVAGSLLNVALVFGGAALLAVGLWRLPTVPRAAPVLMGAAPVGVAAGIVAFAVAPEAGPLLFLLVNAVWGLAWVVIGYHLWRSPRPAGGPAPAEGVRT